jgi:hypothetical protein
MHPSLNNVLRGFRFEQLKPGDAQDVSRMCFSLANYAASNIPSNPELVAGLRKLLEAKDCFVRAVIYAEEDRASEPSNTGEKDKR